MEIFHFGEHLNHEGDIDMNKTWTITSCCYTI